MSKINKSLEELKSTRVKTTFKVEIEVDLPYLDNNDWLDQRIEEIMEEIYNKIRKRETDGHFERNDCYNMGHKCDVFFGYDEEIEYSTDYEF